MAASKDYYRTLGLSCDATTAEIRKVYLLLAHEWHPDKNPGNEDVATEIFKGIGEAYTVLIDRRARREYDAGVTAPRGSHVGRHDVAFYHELYQTVSADAVKEEFMHFVHSHRDMFGKGLPIRTLLSVSERDLMQGSTLQLRLNRREPCRMCSGRGELMQQACPDCRGTARQKYWSTVAVHIPAGTRHGDVIAVEGEGNAGFKGFPAGDLLVRVVEESTGVCDRQIPGEQPA
jgi:molecular chaperone DnaJ